MGEALAQALPETTPGPHFSHSPAPLPQFLLDPQKEFQQHPRSELITLPESELPKPRPRKKPIIAKPILKTKPVEKVEELTAPAAALHTTHEYVSDSMVNLANRLDSFLGSQRADDELNRSSLRLGYNVRMRDSTRGKTQSDVRFNLRLPSIENRLKELTYQNTRKKKKGEAGYGEQTQKEPWRFRTNVGVGLNIPVPTAFAMARLRKNWIYAKWIPRFQQQIAWYTDRSWINNTQMNFDREIQKNRQLFRFVNESDWKITEKNFITTHGPSILHNTSDDDVWSYNFRVNTGKHNTAYFLSGYGFSIGYRRNLLGQWLYGEVVPALDWPKDLGFRRTPGIMFKIESLFGRR